MSTIPQTYIPKAFASYLANGPDIKQAELELKAAKLDVQAARKEFYPSLNISATLGALCRKEWTFFGDDEFNDHRLDRRKENGLPIIIQTADGPLGMLNLTHARQPIMTFTDEAIGAFGWIDQNVYDSEVLMGQLKANGKEVVHEGKGDIVVINTCGFIDNAKEESINTILEYVNLKNKGAVEKVFVTGCLSERYKPDLVREIPDVDQYFGTRDLPILLKAFRCRLRHEW
ncbi:hypothetical protein FQR65_LT16155 [Abscondita terminalis]|nr:hypothetical protein FQR65_LT16155 [Abscondita terminalis]